MTTQATKTLVAKALKEINSIRAIVGLTAIRKMPKGNVMGSLSCPQAKALKAGVETGTCYVSVDGGRLTVKRTWPAHTVKLPTGGTLQVAKGGEQLNMRTPTAMSRFIRLFDARQLPEYIA